MTPVVPAQPDQGAGGILRRGAGDGYEVAVVQRSKDGDWVLPKGDRAPTETWEAAALRKVKEETGCVGRIVDLAPPLAYIAKEQPRFVVFFVMDLVEEGSPQPSDEVRAIEWLTPGAAVSRLTLGEEKHLLERLFAIEAGPGRRRLPSWGPNHRKERLRTSIDEFEAELVYYENTHPDDSLFWVVHARRTAESARQKLEEENINAGWRLLAQARRLRVHGMGPDQLAWERSRILDEATRKLNRDSWRLAAIKGALGTDPVPSAGTQAPSPPPTIPNAQAVHYALEILDEHFANVYMKLDLRASKLRMMPWILGGILIVLGFIVAFGRIPTAPAGSALASFPRFLAILVLAAMGATFSTIVTGQESAKRIPEALQGFQVLALRPLTGMVGGLFVAIIMESGLIGNGVTDALIYPFAIVGGISERLVQRVIEAIEKSVN